VPQTTLRWTWHGDDAMHVFTHTFDYIALSILIACMLSAGAMALYKARYSNPH